MNGLLAGTVVSRNRDDLRPGVQMATSGRRCVFFEADQSRILSSVCSTTGWTISVTSKLTPGPTGTCKSAQARRSSYTVRNQ